MDLKMFSVPLKKCCRKCICAHCLIAKTNGGADGCGDCSQCKGEKPVNNCTDFYAEQRLCKIVEEGKDGNKSR